MKNTLVWFMSYTHTAVLTGVEVPSSINKPARVPPEKSNPLPAHPPTRSNQCTINSHRCCEACAICAYLWNVNESPGPSTSVSTLRYVSSQRYHCHIVVYTLSCWCGQILFFVTLLYTCHVGVARVSFSVFVETMCVRAWNESSDRTGTMTMTMTHTPITMSPLPHPHNHLPSLVVQLLCNPYPRVNVWIPDFWFICFVFLAQCLLAF